MNASAPQLPRHDFLAIAFSLIGITALCWAYLILMARDMSMPNMNMDMLAIPVWNAAYFWMMFTMWAVMMVGMMLPSATPMIMIYAGVARKAQRERMPIASTGAFVCGYLIMWVVYSLFATIIQWQLDQWALLSPLMVSKSPFFGASILVAAGIYQWMPVKNACLKHCRSPIYFISEHWQNGTIGALKMGISHGMFCIGCCWFLMLLLFVGGVMNILWIAAITVFVLLEKVIPLGDQGGRIIGALMIAAGVVTALTGLS